MPIQLEIVTPERLVYEDEVDSVNVPGIEGELGILPHHAPLLSILGFGELRIRKGGAEESFAIVGGFVQVRPDKVVVMAETADLAAEIDLEKAQEARREAERALETGYSEGADLSAARAALQLPARHAAMRIRVAGAATALAKGAAATAGCRQRSMARRRRALLLGGSPRARRPRGLHDRGWPAAVRDRADQRRQECRPQADGRRDPDR